MFNQAFCIHEPYLIHLNGVTNQFMSELNHRKRLLSQREIELARNTLGNAIDWRKVQIADGAWWLLHPHAAITCGNTIVFPPAHYQKDFSQSDVETRAWFIHELVHVWQYQHGYPLLFAGVCLAVRGGYYQARGYIYPALNTINAFRDLNMEQQARVVQHYYLAQQHDPRYLSCLPEFRRLLKPFFQNPDNRRLLPRQF